jgi:acyl-CoA thioester hydrolase
MQTRFADLDQQMHINSIRIGEIFEDARLRFSKAAGFEFTTDSARLLVAALNHIYLAEAQYPHPLEIASAYVAVGRTSWTIGQAAFQDSRCVALCDVTIVNTDSNGPAALSEDVRTRLRAYALRDISEV